MESANEAADVIGQKSIYHFEGNFQRDCKEGDGQLYAKGIWVSKLGNKSVLGTQNKNNNPQNDKSNDEEQKILSEKYSGIFSNDVFHGKGIYIDSFGNMNEGTFENGKMKVVDEKNTEVDQQ